MSTTLTHNVEITGGSSRPVVQRTKYYAQEIKMFGLSRREQRWKADQQAAELLFSLATTTVNAAAQIRAAEAKTDVAELERLRTENAELRRLLARYLHETPLGHQPHMIAHEASEALGANIQAHRGAESGSERAQS